ncbi:MAG: lysophospholipid acyltransferase family protein [Eubacteriales bacterium]
MTRYIWYRIIFFTSRLAFLLFFPPLKFIGREHIPKGGALICGNHTANSDPVIACFAMTLKYDVQPFSKIEMRYVPVIGQILEWGGAIFVDRAKAETKSIKAALSCLKEERKLLIYPEGTRKAEGEEGTDPKTGAAFFAVRGQAPIIPMYIPRHKSRFRWNVVRIGPSYTPEIAGKKPTPEELESITQEIMRRIDLLRQEDERTKKS